MNLKSTTIFLFVIFGLTLSPVHAQNTDEVRVYYGVAAAEFVRAPMYGGGGYDNTGFKEFGLRYLKGISERFFIETGVNYSSSNAIFHPEFIGEPVESKKEEFHLISVPIYAHYTFWRHFFVNGGPLLDFDASDNPDFIDKQAGIGYSLGVGGKYEFQQFSLFVNPNFKQHALFPFQKSSNHQKLTEFGVQFGVGYQF
ncbi:hypothetical protein DN752_18440 [Echinicola strongylocentroti]|uniref:Outer membrane protein beta-barrel domain-containing protein n=1 Tax=Echinicola strongylocentroti TaxID=1795355 RepID=A0A2Z4IMK1_9BACT|nr:outer membrane beta-barrel protein [Echinicola strongylocentroti]AWW31957.1 hypothetical protein DN752_18440 [Echinicola strongylocentroti]